MPHAHIAVGNVDDAIAHLSKIDRSPLFLLVDLQDSVMTLSDLSRLAEVREPSVQVVALGERNDVGLFRSLLKLGVRDYLVKPLTVELLKRTINVSEGKINQVTLSRAGKTIAFAGTRGGVGVTTIALNLARHLAEDTHRRVAYVDLNLCGGAANSMLGHPKQQRSLRRAAKRQPSRPAICRTHARREEHAPFRAVRRTRLRRRREFEPGALKRVIKPLCDSFHYVIVDVADPGNALAKEALDHASRAYLVADRSVHSTRETIRLLRFIEDRDNNPPTSLVLNNPNAVVAGKIAPDDLVSAVGRSALHEVQFEPKALATAENLGEAPAEKAPNGFNQAIARIVGDLTGQTAVSERSFLRKFKLERK